MEDGGSVLVTFITSVASIIVALITAGYFKKKQEGLKLRTSRKKLTEQINTDEIIYLSLKDMKKKYNADRITIMQFHNGDNFYTNSPMQKSSITYEINTKNLEPIARKHQAVLVSIFSWYYKRIIDGDAFFYSVIDDIDDLGTKSFIRMHGAASLAAVPIYDEQRRLVASLAIEWLYNDMPDEIVENEEFVQEFKDKLFKEAQSLVGYL